VSQIITSLSNMIRFCSYAIWENIPRSTYPKATLPQAHLITEFLRLGSLKKKKKQINF